MRTVKATELYPNHVIKSIKYWVSNKGWFKSKGYSIKYQLNDAIKNDAKKLCVSVRNQISGQLFDIDIYPYELLSGDYKVIIEKLLEKYNKK